MTDTGDLHDTTQQPETDDGITSGEQAQDVVDRILEGEDWSDTFAVAGNDEKLVFDVSPIRDRRERYDYLGRMGISADAEDGVEKASLTFDGDTVGAMEDMVVESFSHQHLTESTIRMVVERFSDDTLFEAFDAVMDVSEEVGSVEQFHRE